MKDLSQLHTEATHAVLLTALQLLQERGILPMQDVVSRLEAQEYSYVAGHDHEANPVLQVLIDQLQQIATAYQLKDKPSADSSDA